MTVHTLLAKTTPTTSSLTYTGTIAASFTISAPLPLTGIWAYSGVGCVLPSEIAIYDNSHAQVAGTHKTSPGWSGAAGSGWVKSTYDGSVVLPPGTYTVAGLISGAYNYQDTGGLAGAISGPTIYNFGLADSGGTFQAPMSVNPNTFYMDVEFTVPATTSVSDNFNRADAGNLGANWTAATNGNFAGRTLKIAGDAYIGTAGGSTTSFWNASAVSDDQFSQITITTLPGPADWIGPIVRCSGTDGGNFYVVIAFNTGAGYSLEIFKCLAGNYTLVGSIAGWSPSVGDVVKLEVIGSSLMAYLNGSSVIQATDTALTWGQPGVATSGSSGVGDNWVAGNADRSIHVSTLSSSGSVTTYTVTSTLNQFGTSVPMNMRVLVPDSPNRSFAHSFLWLLPVEPNQGTTFGDSIAVIQALGDQNNFNMTCIQPGFPIDPWYADNDTDSRTQEDTFMQGLVNWAKANIAQSGIEVHYLIGFSKSGVGGQQLFFRHQDIFLGVASWDFPAGMSWSTFGSDDEEIYGTNGNFTANYQLSDANLTTWKAEGNTGTKNLIWIGGGFSYSGDVSTYDTLLTSKAIQHTYASVSQSEHAWNPTPGWVHPALTFLAALGPAPGQKTAALAATGLI